jgi:hypothetical protein
LSARLLIYALCLSVLGACAARPIRLETGPRAVTPEDYEEVYEAWTRGADDFQWGGLNDVLRVTATFESWEFRWGYVVRYAADHALEGETRNNLLRASLDDSQEHHRFFVTISGEVFEEQNLTSARSAWRVVLVDESGGQMEPIAIERVRRPSAAERTYFPTISTHRQAFRIIFPARREDGTPVIPLDAEVVTLRFAGALGQLDVRWELSPPAGDLLP